MIALTTVDTVNKPSKSRRARLLAFYLPQYHPIAENDQWWGPGFTEWTNTAKARPLFKGHVQPHLPGELGFYDLRLPQTRADQARLAALHGVEGFCYYHYWFNGRRVLQQPFEQVLSSGEPDFPFCLCWANETWSGIWHGAPRRILIEQSYGGIEETRSHFEALLPAFKDRRYIRVDNRPLFLIYKPSGLPDVGKTVAQWRQLAIEAGLKGLYLVGCGDQGGFDVKRDGFDAGFSGNLPNVRPSISWRRPWTKLKFKLQQWRNLPTIFDYSDVVSGLIPDSLPRSQIPVAIPNWDNTPRSGARGRVLHRSSPERFRPHLAEALRVVAERPADERLVFLKSWNEWAEGNYVEPDLEFGRQWLNVIDEETSS